MLDILITLLSLVFYMCTSLHPAYKEALSLFLPQVEPGCTRFWGNINNDNNKLTHSDNNKNYLLLIIIIIEKKTAYSN